MRGLKITVTGLALMLLTPQAYCEHFRIATHSQSHYAMALLKLALEQEGGEHTVEGVEHAIGAQSRTLRALAGGTADFDLHFSGYDPEREQELAMVPIPLTRGLLGYRLLAVLEENRSNLSDITTLEELHSQVKIGSGIDWPDTKILRHAGLSVITAADRNLYAMLARQRFDIFPRGMNEVTQELATQSTRQHGQKIVIDPNVMFAYKFDMFFFLAKENQQKASIIERGLRKAYANGTFMDFFENAPQIKDILAETNNQKRITLWLENPLLSDTVRAIPEHFWHQFTQ